MFKLIWFACNFYIVRASALLLLAAIPANVVAQTLLSAPSRAEFRTPPEAAKPRVWWHWMNGNVSKEGITADLEWMQRTGIGGFQMFDAYLSVSQFVDQRLVWYTPEWQDALRHAATEASRLDLEMAMAASGGWSESGGPSVKPTEAMKKLVWSETVVTGGRPFAGTLPRPPDINGPFLDAPAHIVPDRPGTTGLPGAKPTLPKPAPAPDPTYYADVAVLACRVPAGEILMSERKPTITWNGAATDAARLTDGAYGENVVLPYPANTDTGVLLFEFAEPFHVEAFTIAGFGRLRNIHPIPLGQVESSEDGITWRPLLTLTAPVNTERASPARTSAVPPVTARFFRIQFKRSRPNQECEVAEIEFHGIPPVNRWQDKAGFGLAMDYAGVATPPVASDQVIAPVDVIDLTSRMQPDGRINWDAPAGRWRIIRFGYSLTGAKNYPATPEATGFEVDKFNHAHVTKYIDDYVSQAAGAAGDHLGKSFRYLLMDSWEAGMANWTENMLAEFRTRRGYDATTWLPALTGRIVGSADLSDRFLWDWRRTLADLIGENHYGATAEALRRRGMGLYAEAIGTNRPMFADGLQSKGLVDIPMGEFWVEAAGVPDSPNHVADVREAASAAHIYGRKIVAAEAFTSRPHILPWGQAPFHLKALADRNFARGINRIVFHTSAHQPFVDEAHRPGITLWAYGQHYSRNITWAEQAVAWNTYLARCSWLLQQGLFVADIAYFYGEDSPVVAPFWKELQPAVPAGYNFDYINAEVLLTRMQVKDGRLVLPDGMSYRLLVLPRDLDRLTLPVLRKLRELVAAGATLVATRPRSSPSLMGYPGDDDEVRQIASELWGAIDGLSITRHAYKAGRVYSGLSLDRILALEKTGPDFQHTQPKVDTELAWIHRRTDDADLYFVSNQSNRTEVLEAVFRIEGREAELWHPDTGKIEHAAYTSANERTTVPLRLDPFGSVFVVFGQKTAATSRKLPVPKTTTVATLDGPWNVRFAPNLGAPPSAEFGQLISWSNHTDVGVKYFSGSATYEKLLEVPAGWLQPGHRLKLDLGQVKEIAEVTVNGIAANAILWKPPFEVDVTHLLKAGPNRLAVKVTNLWPNRLIGDQALPPEKRHTFTVFHAFTADTPLLESGLLGPVTLIATPK